MSCWRHDLAEHDALARRSPSGQPVTGLSHTVLRWLNVEAGKRSMHKHSYATAIIEHAFLTHYKLHARRPGYLDRLAYGVILGEDAADAAADCLREVEAWAAAPLCVMNTHYAWLFEAWDRKRPRPDGEAARDAHRARLSAELSDAWVLQWQYDGGPVIHLQQGDWPTDARLIPGSPVAADLLQSKADEDVRRRWRVRVGLEKDGNGWGRDNLHLYLDDDIPF
jgi:hypothetical protein